MSEQEKKPRTLDQLAGMDATQQIPSLAGEAPERKAFASEAPASGRHRFGPRSQRKASAVTTEKIKEESPAAEPAVRIDQEEVIIASVAPVEVESGMRILDLDTPAPAPEQPEEKPAETPKVRARSIAELESPAAVRLEPQHQPEPEIHTVDVMPEVDLGDTLVHPMPAAPKEEPAAPEEEEELAGGSTMVFRPQGPTEPVHTESIVFQRPEEEHFEAFETEPEEIWSEDDIFETLDEDAMDLYMDKKRYTIQQYPKIEQYLTEQSRNGYHFVRLDGKTYYFGKAEPRNYYYRISYYPQDPGNEYWRSLTNQGWKEIARINGSRKSFWVILRNTEAPGQGQKEIANDEEKLSYFKKQARSCRSTQFLLFIIMVCLLITAWLQWAYNGYWIIVYICAALLVLCLIFFVVYAHKGRIDRKRARSLQAHLQALKNRQPAYGSSESEEQLEADWQDLEKTDSSRKKKRRRR